jgi:hypothetical protein
MSALQTLFERTWGGSLAELCAATATPLEPLPPEQLAAAQSEADDDDAAERITGALLNWLRSRNQFLELDGADEQQLQVSVERALEVVASGAAAERALLRHRAELAAWVRARLGPTPRDVVAAAYSPALQWEVLGLSETVARPPVLDVGCGEQADLVRFLRTRGIAARGIDRVVPEELGEVADWLTFDYGDDHYGTVLSHLGFSLHFLHHHLAGSERAFDYARTYMAILRSLAPGGRFVYTPGLPFIEALLDARSYRVSHVPFADALRVEVLSDIEQRTGLALSHATHVERLP